MTRLPDQLQDISNVIGLRDALKLAAAKGGQRISIPGKLKEDHWLSQLLGFEVAQKLCQHITNGSRIAIEMPRGPTSSSAKRNSEIFDMLDAGRAVNDIASAFGVSRRWVLLLKSQRTRGVATPTYPDLFDL